MEVAHPHRGRHVQRLLWAIGGIHGRGRRIMGRDPTAEGPFAVRLAGPSGQLGPIRNRPVGSGRSRLDLLVAVHGARADISLYGDLDAFSAGDFLERVLVLVELGARSVVVDLAAVEVVDSNALGALTSAATVLAGLRGEMVLKSPRSRTLRLLSAAGLDDRFVIY